MKTSLNKNFRNGLAVNMLLASLAVPQAYAGLILGDAIGDNWPVSTTRPALTDWAPQGERLASAAEQTSSILPQGDRFVTIHGGVRSTDEVNIVMAPVFEQTWNTETNAAVTESPVFGADGSSYFTPAYPTGADKNLLIKVSPEGQREFAITATQLGDVTINVAGQTKTLKATMGLGGSPIMLNNPSTSKEVVYGATYTRAYAADEDGNLLWNVAIKPAALQTAIDTGDMDKVNEELDLPHRIFGTTYHPAVDAIIIADISGDVIAFDRLTGHQLGAKDMPGKPAKGGDNSMGGNVSEDVINKLAEIFEFGIQDGGIEFQLTGEDGVGVEAILAIMGEGAVIGNQISVDPNSNALWVAATAPDEHDGTVDGFSENGALYRWDLTRSNNEVTFTKGCEAFFDGGTTSTPAVSADGERIYTTDNYGKALAYKKDCTLAWEKDVGEAAVASLAVSSEKGAEIYYPSLTTIYKLQENSDRTAAEIVWQADLNSSFNRSNLRSELDIDYLGSKFVDYLREKTGVEDIHLVNRQAFNLDLASIAQNGINIHSGWGINLSINGTNLSLPFSMNNGLYDRETGELINSTLVLEENIGAMYVSPDGTIVMGSSAIRRGIMRGLVKAPDFLLNICTFGEFIEGMDCMPIPQGVTNVVDWLVKPIQGGITKYGVTQGFDYLARDASCQAEKRIANTILYRPFTNVTSGVEADIKDVKRLIKQAKQAVNDAKNKGEIGTLKERRIKDDLNDAEGHLDNDNLGWAKYYLDNACDELK